IGCSSALVKSRQSLQHCMGGWNVAPRPGADPPHILEEQNRRSAIGCLHRQPARGYSEPCRANDVAENVRLAQGGAEKLACYEAEAACATSWVAIPRHDALNRRRLQSYSDS